MHTHNIIDSNMRRNLYASFQIVFQHLHIGEYFQLLGSLQMVQHITISGTKSLLTTAIACRYINLLVPVWCAIDNQIWQLSQYFAKHWTSRCLYCNKYQDSVSRPPRGRDVLTHWGRDKMAAISQTTLSNTFSWMKMLEFRLRFHWSLYIRVQLTIYEHWFR